MLSRKPSRVSNEPALRPSATSILVGRLVASSRMKTIVSTINRTFVSTSRVAFSVVATTVIAQPGSMMSRRPSIGVSSSRKRPTISNSPFTIASSRAW